MNQQLEELWERVSALPDDRQRAVAQVLRAFLDQNSLEFYLPPENIAEVRKLATDDGPYATDAEVDAVFARLTQMRLRWFARALTELRATYAYLCDDDPIAAKRIVNWIEEATRRLLILPMSDGPDLTQGVHALSVLGAPYVVLYRVRYDIVDILGMAYTTSHPWA
jgi:plasmid stabilization system protein ParE